MKMATMTEDQVREFLLKYAWVPGHTDEQKRGEVDCIMAQGDWEFIDTMADRFAGAQEEPGPKAYSDGEMFALTALYECHDAPHIEGCPYYKNKE